MTSVVELTIFFKGAAGPDVSPLSKIISLASAGVVQAPKNGARHDS